MFRPLTVVSIAAFCLVGWHVYRAEEAASLLDREMRDIGRKTETARERAQVLRAEWAMLNEPERLRQVAQKHLSLESMTPTQFIRLPDLQRRLPVAVAFAGPISLFGSASTTALAAVSPGAVHDLPGSLESTSGSVARSPALVASAQATPVPSVPAPAVLATAPVAAPAAVAPRPAVVAAVTPHVAPAPVATQAPHAQLAAAAPPSISRPTSERATPEPVRAEPQRRRILATPPAAETAIRIPERANLPERTNMAERGSVDRNGPDRSLGGRNPLVADARPMQRGDSLLRTAAHVPSPQPAALMQGGSSLGYSGASRLAPPVPMARPVPIEPNGWSR